MGVLQDQIAAIRANDALSPEEKRAAIYQIKVDALFNEVMSGATDVQGAFLGKTYSYNGVDITVHSVGRSIDPPLRLVVDVTLTKNSVSKRGTYYVTNPLIESPDGSENLLVALGEMFSAWAG